MRTTTAALAATIILSALSTTPARADVTQPQGETCAYLWIEATSELVLRAGPIRVVDEDDPTVPRTATITCSFSDAGATNFTVDDHTHTPIASATGDPGTGVVVLDPTPVTVNALPDYGRLCTELDVDGGPTLYWNESDDRNQEGWWSDSPSATCDRTWEELDHRSEDIDLRYAISAAATALGEADAVMQPVDEQLCQVPDPQDVWFCDAPSVSTTISLVRLGEDGAVVRGLPYNWACTDVHTGLAVTRGSALTTPDPGVTCVPDSPGWDVVCDWMQVSGYLAPTTLGRVDLTSSCGDLTVTRPLVPAQGQFVTQWSGSYRYPDEDTPPWHCLTREDTAAEPVYALSCQLNGYYD